MAKPTAEFQFKAPRNENLNIEPKTSRRSKYGVDFEEGINTSPGTTTVPNPLGKILHPIEPIEGDENEFEILFTPIDDNLSPTTNCLFSNLTVPDIICHIEAGKCQFCNSERHVDPEDMFGIEGFDLFIGCNIALSCPVCMGLELCQDHRRFILQYWDNCPPRKATRRLDEWLHRRLRGFGYEWVVMYWGSLKSVLEGWIEYCEGEERCDGEEWSPAVHC